MCAPTALHLISNGVLDRSVHSSGVPWRPGVSVIADLESQAVVSYSLLAHGIQLLGSGVLLTTKCPSTVQLSPLTRFSSVSQ